MKFGELLRSSITPEWRSHYFEYDEAKSMLFAFRDKVAAATGDPDHLTIDTAPIEEEFFKLCAIELQKVNNFYLEKLNEAKRKLASLNGDLAESNLTQQKEHGSLLHRKSSKSMDLHDFRLAFSEFYYSLTLLKNFQQLNITAFRKVLKKHDKILRNDRGEQYYHQTVHGVEFAHHKSLEDIMIETEEIVVQKLESGDHKRAMNRLRVPPLGQPRHSPWTLIRIGLMAGLLMILTALLILLGPMANCTAGTRGCWKHISQTAIEDPDSYDADEFWQITIRMYRGLFLFSIMVLLLGVNIHGWRKSGVNHVLIFELDPRNHLSALHLIEAGFALLVLCSTSLLFWMLQYYFNYVFGVPQIIIRFCSIAFIFLLFAYLINPIPIFMYSSRLWFLKALGRIFAAPFFTVRFSDFWLADQFMSLIPVFQDMIFISCSCAVMFHPLDIAANCRKERVAKGMLMLLPVWVRLMQCFRRYYDSRKAHPHLSNAGKYFVTGLVIVFRTLHSMWKDDAKAAVSAAKELASRNHSHHSHSSLFMDKAMEDFATLATTTEDPGFGDEKGGLAFLLEDVASPYFICWVVVAAISTIYSYIWDIKMDWGFFESKVSPENRFLRDHLVFRHKWYYYSAIVVDWVLRLSWTLQVANIQVSPVASQSDMFITALSFIEVARRFMWNFFRLENEHLHNVESTRVVREIYIRPANTDDDLKQIERMMDEEDGVSAVRRELRGRHQPEAPSKPRHSMAQGLGIMQAVVMAKIAASRFHIFHRASRDVDDDDDTAGAENGQDELDTARTVPRKEQDSAAKPVQLPVVVTTIRDVVESPARVRSPELDEDVKPSYLEPDE